MSPTVRIPVSVIQGDMMESLRLDMRFALRALLKARAFTFIAVITLALGIGSTSTILGIVRSVLLHDLPFADSNSLVFLRETAGTALASVSYPNYLDWREQNRVFSELAAYSSSDLSLTTKGAAERSYGEIVTDSYFTLLRVTPALGRNFTKEENQNPGAPPVAIISTGLWKRDFGASNAVLGRTIKVNDAAFTIIGIAPENFEGISAKAEVWIPLSMRDLLFPQSAQFHFNSQRDIHWHRAIGRLKPGVTLNQAQQEMKTIAARLALAYPGANRERGVQVTLASDVYLGPLRSPLLLLLGAAVCIFIIACFNVANLFMIRAARRSLEIALKSALGAGRTRLARQWILEGILVALAGGTLGFALAGWSIASIVRILPVRLPAFSTVTMDSGIFVSTLILSIITGAVIGGVATLRDSRRDLAISLQAAKSSTGPASSRWSSGLVAGEIAVAVVITIGAGLLLRSFQELRHTNPGFVADRLLTARFEVPAGYTGDARWRVGPQISDRIGSLPQVESTALTVVDPFLYGGINRSITVDGHTPLSAAEQDEIYVQEISPSYFATMKIPTLSGRDFNALDTSSAPHVVIVSHAFARRYWPGQAAIGKRLKYGPADSKREWMEVVGEVEDVRFASLRTDPSATAVIYAPLLQGEVINGLSVVVRTRTEPGSVLGTVREEIQRLDPEIPVYSVATLESRIDGDTDSTRSFAILLASFAFLGVGLAAIGAYAAMAANVSGRTREIGIRMALGANPFTILRMILIQGSRLAVAGIVTGLVAGLGVSHLLVNQLYGVQPTDPLTFLFSAALLSLIAAAACWIPARQAMQADPLSALRSQ